jgi:hypothetical protein
MKSKEYMTKLRRFSPTTLVLAALATTAAGFSGCADRVSAKASPCPCAVGNICCSSGQCAVDQVGCDQAVLALRTQAAGTWTGHLENFTFASGSDAIEISISVAADGTTSGHITLGTGPVPPPPTDPNVGWPADLTSDDASAKIYPALEGFPYNADSIHWEADRLKFVIDRYSPWQAWCQLQTEVFPSSAGGTGYACAPDGYFVRDDQGNCIVAATSDATTGTPVNCVKYFPLCVGTPAICACNAGGCSATHAPDVSFDIALRNGEGDGSTTLKDMLTNIRLTQTSHRD